jgi:RimJ/RimL family protein N-acetyltransferase
MTVYVISENKQVKSENIVLRPVTHSDCDTIFEMANDPLTRQNAFTTDKIPYDKHVPWFSQKIESELCLFYIAEIEGNIIGQIRIDCSNDKRCGTISFSVHRDHRGKGYASKILQHTLSLPEVRKIDVLIGEVKVANVASQKAFQKAGFKKERRGDIIRFCFEVE